MMRRVDLLPPAYVERRRQRRLTATIVIVGLVLLVLLILWWLLLGAQITDARNELATIEQQNAELQAQIDELQQFAELENEVLTKRQALQTVMAGDIAWPALLTDLALVIPGDVWLGSLQASAGLTEAAAPVATETAAIRISSDQPFGRMTFTGNALSMPGVAKWLIRLGTVREFEAVWLNDATKGEGETTGVDVVSFSNTIEINQRAASERFQGELQ